MNSEIDNNSDDLYSLLMELLLKESVTAAPLPAPQQEQGTVTTGQATAADFELEQLDPLDLEEVNISPYNTSFSAQDVTRAGSADILAREATQQTRDHNSYQLGEMPTVQDRFQALIKRRLQVEIERHPPLFPWETEISSYEPDFADVAEDGWVPRSRTWMPELKKFALPAPIPENVLSQLLDACSDAASSSLKLGAKMVNAVESLFPEESGPLNQLAGVVLMSPPRYSQASAQRLQSIGISYEEAATEQKMTLALLAAKEIINSLSWSILPTQIPRERQWQTTAGVLRVTAHYQLQAPVPSLRLVADLPQGGSLTLRAPETSTVSQRSEPGQLSVEAFDVEPNQSYSLEIQFHDSEQKPLTFAIFPQVKS
ncbi:MAG: hypothetical protein F6K58_03685 [Symploca sp. SIO2E9]|nr:hypothetical protein [Symploca sp. SIO2E9]